MTEFYQYPTKNFKGDSQKLTIATGPVIIDKEGKYLLHISPSTGKFQFTGGRLNDEISIKKNSMNTPLKDLGIEIEIYKKINPFVIVDNIEREGNMEKLVLIHYIAIVKNYSQPLGKDAQWFSINEIKDLEQKGEVSSPNILLACKHFSKYNEK